MASYLSCMPFETKLEDPIGLSAKRGEDGITWNSYVLVFFLKVVFVVGFQYPSLILVLSQTNFTIFLVIVLYSLWPHEL